MYEKVNSNFDTAKLSCKYTWSSISYSITLKKNSTVQTIIVKND